MCGNKFTYEIATFGLESSSPQFITGGTKLPRSYDITLHYRGVAASHVLAMNHTLTSPEGCLSNITCRFDSLFAIVSSVKNESLKMIARNTSINPFAVFAQ